LRAFGLLLRFYSYLFHLAVSFFLLGLGIVSAASSTPLHLDAFGLPAEKALLGVFVLGIVGLFSTVLAFTGTFRLLFPLWAAAVVWLMVKGFFLSSYAFSGLAGFRSAILLTLGAIASFFGALWVLKPRSRL
jgi:uncharacterized membrane protein YkvI